MVDGAGLHPPLTQPNGGDEPGKDRAVVHHLLLPRGNSEKEDFGRITSAGARLP
ncbi:hypothetical protein D3C80_1759150 [compost metagenome]